MIGNSLLLRSRTSTGYFSGSTCPSVTNRRFSSSSAVRLSIGYWPKIRTWCFGGIDGCTYRSLHTWASSNFSTTKCLTTCKASAPRSSRPTLGSRISCAPRFCTLWQAWRGGTVTKPGSLAASTTLAWTNTTGCSPLSVQSTSWPFSRCRNGTRTKSPRGLHELIKRRSCPRKQRPWWNNDLPEGATWVNT